MSFAQRGCHRDGVQGWREHGLAHVILTAAAIALPCISSPSELRFFSHRHTLWIVSPSALSAYSFLSKSSRNVELDENAVSDSITDVVEYDGVLWVAARSGLYQVDMATGTVERLPERTTRAPASRVAADQDYIWCASHTDTLWQFDKLGREWFAYPAPAEVNEKGEVLGVVSTQDNVIIIHESGALVFFVGEEKWRQYPIGDGRISGEARVRTGAGLITIADQTSVWRFRVGSLVWEHISTPEPLRDLLVADTMSFLVGMQSVFSITASSPALVRLDIAGLHQPCAAAKIRDTLYVVTARGLSRYVLTTRSTDQWEHPPQLAEPFPVALTATDSNLVVVHRGALAVYNIASADWNVSDLVGGAQGKSRKVMWNDEGLRVRYAPGYSSTLRGTTSKKLKQHDRTLEVETVRPWLNAVPDETNLSLHTTLGTEGYIDLFYDDSRKDQVPLKGAMYSGASDDVLRGAQVGTIGFSSPHRLVLPDVKVEGGAIQLQSIAKLPDRDRRVFRSSAGGGLIVTRTHTAILAYRPETRSYTLPGATIGTHDTTMIVPGTVRVFVDGERVDSTFFRVAYPTRTIQFTRDDIVDPTSVIQVEYQVRTIPDSGVGEIEWVPENNFGQIAFANFSLSPASWLSPTVGYTYLWDKLRHDIVSVSLPMEYRTEESMVKFDPQIAFDVWDSRHSMAAGASFTGRLGRRFSCEANGFWTDSSFVSSDILSRGYGIRTAEGDFRLTYDIVPEVPISYYQHNRRATGGKENRYEFSTSILFPRYPKMVVSVTRNVVDAVLETTTLDSATGQLVRGTNDTIDNVKDKARVRLYETSSPFLERLTRMYRVAYDLSWTEFRAITETSDDWRAGRVVYGRGTIMPIEPLSLSFSGIYRINPAGMRFSRTIEPAISIQTTDWPKGIDLTGYYKVKLRRLSMADSSLVDLDRGTEMVAKLGAWWAGLRWLTLRGGVAETRTCAFATVDPSPGAVVLGTESVRTVFWRPSAGLTIFPGSAVLFVSTNDWSLSDTSHDFRTVNDLKLWLGRRSQWQTRWQMETHRQAPTVHQGISHYDKTWNSWLKTGQGIFANYLRSDTLRIVQAGPEANIEITLKDVVRILRGLRMSHSVRLSCERRNGIYEWNPDMSYTFYLRPVAKPNIVFEMNGTLTMDSGAFQSYDAEMWLRLVF